MSFDYTMSEDEVQDDNSSGEQLRKPYIGPADPVGLKFDTDPETFGDKNVLVFTFEATSDDQLGRQLEHVEWPPTSDGPVNDFGESEEDTDGNGNNNFQNMMRRLYHILKRILPVDEETVREDILVFRGETETEAWNRMGKLVQQYYDKYGFADEEFEIKAQGNVNSEGYVSAEFNRYPKFIRVVGEDPELEFSNWEQSQNQEALQALNSDPDDTDEFEDDDDFDYDVEDTDF